MSTDKQPLTSRGIVESLSSVSRNLGVSDSEGRGVIFLRVIHVCVSVDRLYTVED